MTEKTMKIPGPDHPITVTPSTAHITVKAGGQVIADTRGALVLQEAAYKPAYYIPRADVDFSLLARTEHMTYCPYKGDCNYYSIIGAAHGENAVWSYEKPYAAVAEIKEFLAFYPDRVEIVVG